ncbi:MAG: chalcone isomerase family protein [Planctomycetota bacterium]|nr:chalcone isomerase family protein [Planctomycetota bacterium]MDA1114511.1 chalcone isomerase family protein [Planctomycetota bacterium]
MIRPIAITLLALLPLAAFAQTQEPKKPEKPAPTVLEAETDIRFPIWMDLDALKGERHYLFGTGVREKTIFQVNVYGFGWYADRDAALPILRKAAGAMNLKSALNDEKFHEAFLSDNYNKSMRWVMARDVDGEDVAEAFDDILEPGIRKIAKDKKALDTGLAAMKQLRGYFASGQLDEGDEIIFIWETGGKLHTIVNNHEYKVIENFHVCYAMFEVFMNEDPIDKNAKEMIVKGVYPYMFPDRN